MARASVSAVIPTKNVASIITPTLDSLRFCDEVVIVDMFSEDDTKTLCCSYPNVTFYERHDYIYGNFNYGLDVAQGEWILRFDSDEVVSPALRESIDRVLNDPHPAFAAYDSACHLFFFGRRLRHGFGKARRLTLFRKGVTRYTVQSEHEWLSFTGPIGQLHGYYEHFTNPTISAWIKKIDYYTARDVERDSSKTPPSRLRVALKTLRLFQRLYLSPHWMARDGELGFYVSGIVCFAFFLQHAKLWERLSPAARLLGAQDVGGAELSDQVVSERAQEDEQR
jgi:glycosyltransferase involved in cell wall biosynthesis